MKQFILFCVVTFSVFQLFAQVDSTRTNNPFELPGRGLIITPFIVNPEVKIDTPIGNPFEVTTFRDVDKAVDSSVVSLELPKWIPQTNQELSEENDTRFQLFFGAFALLASIALMIQFLKQLKEGFGTIVQFNLFQQLARQESGGIAFSLLYGLFIVLVSWLLYNTLRYFGYLPDVSLWIRLPLVLFVLVLIICLRRAAIWLTGRLFQAEKETKMFLFQEAVTASCALFPLLLCVLLSTFGPESIRIWMLYIGLGIIGFCFVYVLIRGVMILSLSTEFSIIRFLSYLCAVEIAPAVLLLKFWFIWSGA